LGDGELHFKVDGRLEMADDEVRVHHLKDIGMRLYFFSEELLSPTDGEIDFFFLDIGIPLRRLQSDLFEVEDDVDDVFVYTTDRREFMIHAGNPHGGNCISLE